MGRFDGRSSVMSSFLNIGFGARGDADLEDSFVLHVYVRGLETAVVSTTVDAWATVAATGAFRGVRLDVGPVRQRDDGVEVPFSAKGTNVFSVMPAIEVLILGIADDIEHDPAAPTGRVEYHLLPGDAPVGTDTDRDPGSPFNSVSFEVRGCSTLDEYFLLYVRAPGLRADVVADTVESWAWLAVKQAFRGVRIWTDPVRQCSDGAVIALDAKVASLFTVMPAIEVLVLAIDDTIRHNQPTREHAVTYRMLPGDGSASTDDLPPGFET